MAHPKPPHAITAQSPTARPATERAERPRVHPHAAVVEVCAAHRHACAHARMRTGDTAGVLAAKRAQARATHKMAIRRPPRRRKRRGIAPTCVGIVTRRSGRGLRPPHVHAAMRSSWILDEGITSPMAHARTCHMPHSHARHVAVTRGGLGQGPDGRTTTHAATRAIVDDAPAGTSQPRAAAIPHCARTTHQAHSRRRRRPLLRDNTPPVNGDGMCGGGGALMDPPAHPRASQGPPTRSTATATPAMG